MNPNKVTYIKELIENIDSVDWKEVGLDTEYNRGIGEFECSLREGLNTLKGLIYDETLAERMDDGIEFKMNNGEAVFVELDAIFIDLLASIQKGDLDDAEGYLSELQVYLRRSWEKLKGK